MEKYIQEENFFKYCTWICHALCGIAISKVLADSLLLNEYDSAIIQRSCGKMPKWILIEQSHSAYYNSFVTGNMILILVGLGMHFSIFLRQRHLERQQSSDYFVSCDLSNVKIIRKSKQANDPSSLCRFKRNVISPLGSFSSFLVTTVYNILLALNLFSTAQTGPTLLNEIHFFLVHVVYFFCLNLIESIFSPTLLMSLVNVLPSSSHEYRAVTV